MEKVGWHVKNNYSYPYAGGGDVSIEIRIVFLSAAAWEFVLARSIEQRLVFYFLAAAAATCNTSILRFSYTLLF